MRFWAGLYPESMKEIIMAGADSMLKTALRILGSQRERVLLDDQEPFKHLLIRRLEVMMKTLMKINIRSGDQGLVGGRLCGLVVRYMS